MVFIGFGFYRKTELHVYATPTFKMIVMTSTEKRNNNREPRMRDNPMWLYDMSILDKTERSTKALYFESGFEVAKFLSHKTTAKIARAINKVGKYVTGKDGKQWAVRVKVK